MALWCDVYDANDNRTGIVYGLLTCRVARELDRVTDFEFNVPIAHPKSTLLTSQARIILYSSTDSGKRKLTDGIIQTVVRSVRRGEIVLVVRGLGLMEELRRRTVLVGLRYQQETVQSIADDLISNVSGWSVSVDSTIASNTLDARFDGISILRAFQEIAERYGWHLRSTTTRTLELGPLGAASSKRIINAEFPIKSDDLLIAQELVQETVTEELVNRIYPLGSGEGINALTLQKSNRASQVLDLPTAGFTATSYGRQVTITSTARGIAISYTYDMGDSTTYATINPIHLYAAAGDYTVSQTVYNAGGSDTATKTVTVTDVAQAPAKPTNLSASVTSSQIGLSWDVYDGESAITSSTINYREAGTTSWSSQTVTGAGTSAVIGSLTANTVYDVRVQCTNAEGTSEWSDTSYFQTGYDTPLGLLLDMKIQCDATIDDGKIYDTGVGTLLSGSIDTIDDSGINTTCSVIKWEPVPIGSNASGLDERPLLGYFGSDTSKRQWNQVPTVFPNHSIYWWDGTTLIELRVNLFYTSSSDGRFMTNRPPTSGQPAAGPSITASSNQRVIMATKGQSTKVQTYISGSSTTEPGKPVLTQQGSSAHNTISVSWTVADGGSLISSQTLEYKLSSASSWNDVTVGANDRSKSISGLSASTSYDFRVRATNSIGTGTWSDTLTVSTSAAPATAPGVPTIDSITVSNGAASVAFTAPTSDGGSAITKYTVRYRVNGSAASWTSVDGTTSPIAVTALSNGTTYEFQIAAFNFAYGSYSASTTAQPYTTPDAPTLSATAGDAQVSLSWTVPTNTGGTGITITGYVYEYKLTSASTWTASSSQTATSATVSSLTNSSSYDFRVKATNSKGASSSYSTVVSATPSQTVTAPGVPTGLTLTPGNTQISAAFSDPANNGGASITNYRVRHRTGSGSWTTKTGASSPIVITGLTNGTAYQVQVAAYNSAGWSSWSSSVTATPRTTPGQPTLTVTTGNGTASLSWTAPSAGGSTITGYQYAHKKTSESSWATGTTTSTSHSLSGLDNGTQYDFRVRAQNAAGYGDWSTTQTGTPSAPATTPGVPSFTLSVSDSQVDITITAPADNGGSAITGYAIAWKASSSLTFTISNITTTTKSFTSLQNGTTYQFRVAAKNAQGTGNYTATQTATPSTTPGKVTGLSLTPGNQQIACSWTAPGTGGSAITLYYVDYRAGSSGDWTTATTSSTSYTISSLTNGTEYQVRVAAYNTNGTGSESDVGKSTPRTVPGAPGSPPTVTAGEAQFTAKLNPGTETTLINGNEDDRNRSVSSNTTNEEWAQTFRISATSVITSFTMKAYKFASAARELQFQIEGVDANDKPDGTIVASGAKGTYDEDDLSTSSSGAEFSVTLTDPTMLVPGDYALVLKVSDIPHPANFSRIRTETSSATTALLNLWRGDESGGSTTWYLIGSGNEAAYLILKGVQISDGGSAITGFAWQYQLQSASDWTDAPDTTISETTISGLQGGSTYVARNAYINAAGTGSYSGASSGVTPTSPATVPGTPAAPTLTAGDAQISATVTPPSNGGSAITGYGWRIRESGGGGTWATSTTTGTTKTFSSLFNGTTYEVQVRATNAQGDSGYSSSQTATPVSSVTAPGSPTGFSATGGDAQVDLVWTAPADAGGGGATISGYNLAHKLTANSSWIDLTDAGASDTSRNVPSLTNGSSYDFRIRAVNSSSLTSNWVTASATPTSSATVPDPPTLTATAASQSVTITINPGSDGGESITSYILNWKKTSASTWQSSTFNSQTTTKTVSNLDNGSEYQFRARAVNSIGQSNWSTVITSTPAQAPGSPTIAVSPSDTILNITLTLGSDGGSTILDSEIAIKEVSGSSWVGANTFTITGTSTTRTNLTNGTTYYLRARSRNAAGYSGWGNTASATPYEAPGKPTSVTATQSEDDIDVSWTAPANNGGKAVTGYDVQHKAPSESSWTDIATDETNTSYTLQAVTAVGTHTFRVRAVNGADGAWSDEATVTFVGPPSTPTGLAVSISGGDYTASWDAVSNATSYTLRCQDTSTDVNTDFAAITTTSTTQIDTLAEGIYEVQVNAKNINSTSAFSAPPISVHVVDSPQGTGTLDPPANLKLYNYTGTGSIMAVWDTVSGASAYSIQLSGGPQNIPWEHKDTVTTNSHTISGLLEDETYSVRVATVNHYGTGTYSTAQSITIGDAPTQPPAPTLSQNSATVLVVDWDAIDDAASYSVKWRASGGSWTYIHNISASQSYKNITGLTAGTTYEAAYDWYDSSHGHSTYSETVSRLMQGSVSAPTVIDLSATHSSGDSYSFTLSWTAESSADNYDVRYRVASGTWTTFTAQTGTSKSWTATVTSGQTLEAQIKAQNSFSYSNWSSVDDASWSVPTGVFVNVVREFTVTALSNYGADSIASPDSLDGGGTLPTLRRVAFENRQKKWGRPDWKFLDSSSAVDPDAAFKSTYSGYLVNYKNSTYTCHEVPFTNTQTYANSGYIDLETSAIADTADYLATFDTWAKVQAFVVAGESLRLIIADQGQEDLVETWAAALGGL